MKTIIIKKQTPKGEKEVVLDYESGTASIEGLPFREIKYGSLSFQGKTFIGLYFVETNLLDGGKRIFITLPNAPEDFRQAVGTAHRTKAQKAQVKKLERIHEGFTLMYKQQYVNNDWPTLALDKWEVSSIDPGYKGYDYLKGLDLTDKEIRGLKPANKTRTYEFAGWSKIQLTDYTYNFSPEDVLSLEKLAKTKVSKKEKEKKDYLSKYPEEKYFYLFGTSWETGIAYYGLRDRVSREDWKRIASEFYFCGKGSDYDDDEPPDTARGSWITHHPQRVMEIMSWK